MDERVDVFLLYVNDGSQIAEVLKKSLEKTGVTVRTADIKNIHDLDQSYTSAAILILTPGLLFVLQSSCLPDLTWLQPGRKTCALFYHETINFTGKSVQDVLDQQLPSYHKWRSFPLVRKARTLTMKILELLESEDEESCQELYLVSECTFYPDYVWMENQNVFISFNTERTRDDRVTIEVDKRIIEATWVNPYTFFFTCKDCGTGGHQMIKLCVNEAVALITDVVIKDRDRILLDEINEEDSPLHYLQSTLKKIKYNESALLLDSTNTKVLEGTTTLLKRLNKIPDDVKLERSTKGETTPQEEKEENRTNKEDDSYITVQRRVNSQFIRSRRRTTLGRSEDHGYSSTYSEHPSERISRALQILTFEDIPAITVNPETKKALPEDFFDSLEFS